MMKRLIAHGEELGRRMQERHARSVAERLREIFGSSVERVEGRVSVRGRGIVKRWLTDASLRFIAGAWK